MKDTGIKDSKIQLWNALRTASFGDIGQFMGMLADISANTGNKLGKHLKMLRTWIETQNIDGEILCDKILTNEDSFIKWAAPELVKGPATALYTALAEFFKGTENNINIDSGLVPVGFRNALPIRPRLHRVDIVIDLDGTILVQGRDPFLDTFDRIYHLSPFLIFSPSSFESRPISFEFENRRTCVVFRALLSPFLQTFAMFCNLHVVTRSCVAPSSNFVQFLERTLDVRFSSVVSRECFSRNDSLRKSSTLVAPIIVDDDPLVWTDVHRNQVIPVIRMGLIDCEDNLRAYSSSVRALGRFKDMHPIPIYRIRDPRSTATFWWRDRELLLAAIRLATELGRRSSCVMTSSFPDVLTSLIIDYMGGDRDLQRLMLLLDDAGFPMSFRVQSMWAHALAMTGFPISRLCPSCRFVTQFHDGVCIPCHAVSSGISDSSDEDSRELKKKTRYNFFSRIFRK